MNEYTSKQVASYAGKLDINVALEIIREVVLSAAGDPEDCMHPDSVRIREAWKVIEEHVAK